jgi:uncharacterized MAPEG superfamily protein
MTIELNMLALSIVLGLVHISLASSSATLKRGIAWNASARDAVQAPLPPVAGRLERALRNFLETFPLFAAAVLVAHEAGRHSWLTEWGAQTYLAARVVYLPLYAAGVPWVRSAVWSVAVLGIVMVLAGLWR